MKNVLKLFFVISIGALPYMVPGQNSINLADLYKAVDLNNPLSRIPNSIDSVYRLKKEILNLNYLPKFDLNASSTWQSDVTSLNVNLPAALNIHLPKPDKDQHKVTFDMTELLWDGGATKAKRELEDLTHMLEKNRVNIEIVNLKDRITSIFFNLLIIKVTEDQLKLMSDDVDKRIKEIESSVNAGFILVSTLDGLKAEKLKLLQNIDAVPAQRKSLISSLKSLTGLELNENDIYILPNPDIIKELTCLRPEFEGFKHQQNVLNASSGLTARKRYPVIAGFASAGYGKPGLNMLSNSWDTYYMLGAKLSWNIWDWNSVRKDRQQLKIQEKIVDYRKQAYLDSYQSQIEGIQLEMQKLNNQLSKDIEIVQLLHQVTERSASSLKNGTITTAVYLADFNSESRAQLELELRKIKISLQKVLLYNISGNELINK